MPHSLCLTPKYKKTSQLGITTLSTLLQHAKKNGDKVLEKVVQITDIVMHARNSIFTPRGCLVPRKLWITVFPEKTFLWKTPFFSVFVFQIKENLENENISFPCNLEKRVFRKNYFFWKP